MANLNMDGSFELKTEVIEKEISKKSAGNYALGRVEKGTFYVNYVGRSDSDIKARLLSWVGKKEKYRRFKYSYATSPKAAFEKECRNYHDFGGSKNLDNESHPQRPEDTDWKCPKCDIFD